jgi:hypothetical protein
MATSRAAEGTDALAPVADDPPDRRRSCGVAEYGVQVVGSGMALVPQSDPAAQR